MGALTPHRGFSQLLGYHPRLVTYDGLVSGMVCDSITNTTLKGTGGIHSNQIIVCVVSEGRALLMTPNEANNGFTVS